MFNWLKNSVPARQDLPQVDIADSNFVSESAMNESMALKEQGNAHLNNGNLEKASFCYRRAIELNPRYAEAHNNLGYVFQLQGNLDEAVVRYRKAIELNPELLPAHQNLGLILLNLGKNETAEKNLRKVVELNPDNAEALQSLGAIAAQRGDLPEAEALLGRALKLQPENAEAHYNLGVLLMESKRLSEAEAAYRRALQVRPDYAEVYYNLGVLFEEDHRLPEAETAYCRALEIKPDYAKVHYNLGVLLGKMDRLLEAETSYRRALEIKPDFVEAHSNLGALLMNANRLSEAEACCRRAQELKPDSAEANNSLGCVLCALWQLDAAVASYLKALEIKPDFAEAHANLGNALFCHGQLDDAADSYRQAIKIKPDFSAAYSGLGTVLRDMGRMEEAERHLTKGVELAPGDAMPISALLALIPYRQDDPRFSHLEAVYAKRYLLPFSEHVTLNFAMGKAMETIRQYDKSFSAYEEGNRLCCQQHRFDDAEDEHCLEDACKLFSAGFFSKFTALSLPAIPDKRVPIFIVGMPRSGTSLIEQILASHPALFGAGELEILDKLAKQAALCVDSTDFEKMLLDLRKFGQEYLDQVWRLAPDAIYITDKMPGNYFSLGLIHLMLPNAKIIHSMRDPMDTCFSCYSSNFTVGHEYSHDLGALGRHYVRYRKFMQHWHDVLPPGRILDVRYENNVANPEHEARRLLEYLDLPWDPACLKFYETKREVRTASVTQVRKPIYRSSVARWKHFEKHLAPLFETIYPETRKDV